MPVINHQESPEIEMRPGIRGQFLASTEYGARAVCLLVNTVAPGAAAPLHKHTVEETVVVLEGTVWVRIGDERYTVGPQHTVIIPAETPHAWGNAGPDVAKLLWAFGGPDPFRDSTYLEGAPPAYSTLDPGKICDNVQKLRVSRRIWPLIPYYTLDWASLLGSGSSDHCACQQQLHNSHGALAFDPYSCQQSPVTSLQIVHART